MRKQLCPCGVTSMSLTKAAAVPLTCNLNICTVAQKMRIITSLCTVCLTLGALIIVNMKKKLFQVKKTVNKLYASSVPSQRDKEVVIVVSL